jgi:hypothetical protein
MMKLKLAKWIHANLAGERYEHVVPGDQLKLEFGEHDPDPGPKHDRPMFTAVTSNDGYELWIAYTGGKWLVHFRKEYARQLAWFIIWDWWAKATWFGIKRKIWYWSNKQVLYSMNPKLKERL